jgi:hypothetical protein
MTPPVGTPGRERCTLNFTSATAITIKCEISTDGKTWMPTFDGKATKTK